MGFSNLHSCSPGYGYRTGLYEALMPCAKFGGYPNEDECLAVAPH